MQQGLCPYYQYQAEAEPRDPVHPARVPITVYAYCTHKHSPASASAVLFTAEGRHLLKCGGDLSKCQIPSHLNLDVGPA